MLKLRKYILASQSCSTWDANPSCIYTRKLKCKAILTAVAFPLAPAFPHGHNIMDSLMNQTTPSAALDVLYHQHN